MLRSRDDCLEALPDSRDATALHAQAMASVREDDLGAAASLLRRALRIQPLNSQWHCDLGVVYAAAGLWPRARKALAKSLALQADDPVCLSAYAEALLECELFGEALEAFRQAQRISPRDPGVFQGIGRSLAALERYEEALQALDEVSRLDPDSSFTFEYLAHVHDKLKQNDEALACSERAVQLNPESPAALNRLAVAYSNVGELGRCIVTLRKAVQLDPGASATRSSLLQALLHDPVITPCAILREHQAWAATYKVTRKSKPRFENAPDPDRRLRIGYLSAEFFFNPSFFFLAPIFGCHDPEFFDTVFYHTRPGRDEWTDRFRAMTLNWREVYGRTDQEVASLVKKDRIDILVDVSGHFPYSRLRAFMFRVAPVQIEYLNYPASTGLAEADYFLTDEWTDPAGLTEAHYTEQLCRLPSGYLAYLPPEDAPAAGPLPAARNGYVTFGLFQRPAKTNDRVWDAAAQVLMAVPRSRLLIHYVTRDFDNPNSRVRRSITEALTSRGVDEQRLEFKGALGMSEHLACVTQADIALDTFPYNGQTTTCESLWMGVPVITLTGNSHVSRVAHAILHRVGLGDWAASSIEEYAEIAARVDLDVLAELRAGMRERLAASSLLDGPRVTREIEQAYRSMWRTWCSSHHRNRPRISGAGR